MYRLLVLLAWIVTTLLWPLHLWVARRDRARTFGQVATVAGDFGDADRFRGGASDPHGSDEWNRAMDELAASDAKR